MALKITPRVFCTLMFPNQLPIDFFQYDQGPGVGTTVNCIECLWDIDDVLDDGNASHWEHCTKHLPRPKGKKKSTK